MTVHPQSDRSYSRKQIRALEIIHGTGSISAEELQRRLFTNASGESQITGRISHLVQWDHETECFSVRPEKRREVDSILKAGR